MGGRRGSGSGCVSLKARQPTEGVKSCGCEHLSPIILNDAFVLHDRMFACHNDARGVAARPASRDVEDDDGSLVIWWGGHDPKVLWAARIQIDEGVTQFKQWGRAHEGT